MSSEPAAETADLKSLEGVFTLQGVSFDDRIVRKDYWGDTKCNHCTFVLDGKTYTAVEDPSDGYRSSMEHLLVGGSECTNMFPVPCYVIARFKERSDYNRCDILELFDIFTGECVLEVGTSNTDDYYPSFVASFDPKAMAANKYGT